MVIMYIHGCSFCYFIWMCIWVGNLWNTSSIAEFLAPSSLHFLWLNQMDLYNPRWCITCELCRLFLLRNINENRRFSDQLLWITFSLNIFPKAEQAEGEWNISPRPSLGKGILLFVFIGPPTKKSCIFGDVTTCCKYLNVYLMSNSRCLFSKRCYTNISERVS